MSYVPSFQSGNYKAVCDLCGRVFKADQLRLTWDGLRVCSKDFEERHPQDFVKAIYEDSTVPWARPEQEDIFQIAEHLYCEDNYSENVSNAGFTDYTMFGKTVLATSIFHTIPFTSPFGYVWG